MTSACTSLSLCNKPTTYHANWSSKTTRNQLWSTFFKYEPFTQTSTSQGANFMSKSLSRIITKLLQILSSKSTLFWVEIIYVTFIALVLSVSFFLSTVLVLCVLGFCISSFTAFSTSLNGSIAFHFITSLHRRRHYGCLNLGNPSESLLCQRRSELNGNLFQLLIFWTHLYPSRFRFKDYCLQM